MLSHKILILLSFLIFSTICEDCSNLNGEYGCQSGQHQYPDDWSDRVFQTPPRGSEHYRDTYQDMHLLVGYVQTIYNSQRTEATLTFITQVNEKELPSGYTLLYNFGGKEQTSNTLTVNQSYKDGMSVSARIVSNGNDIATLQLEDLYFYWDNAKINLPSNYENGQKGAIVEFFGWPFEDVEQECDFLSTAGYLGAKVFPPQEAIFTFDTCENGELNPWWFVYQPVSYRMHSRMGTKKQFKSLINTCRSKNVRIYADAVVNHMAGNGNDMYWDHRNPSGGSCVHWGPKAGSAGSPWWTTGWQYENNPYSNNRPGLEFPAVPYTVLDFHCERALNSWTDGDILNYGWLTGLTDLNTEREYVRQRIADYITDLLSMGVSGVRIDAAKHISPESLSHIFLKIKKNLGGSLPDDFTAYLEVLFGGEKDLLFCNDNWYNYGPSFANKMKEVGLSDDDVYKIKIWGSDYPKEHPICGWWNVPSERMAIELDCHDDQNPGSSSRDMGDKGSVYIKEKDANKHRNFEVEMFTRTDGNWKIRLILSSYSFMNNGAAGFPDGNSDCSKCNYDTQCSRDCNKSVPYQKAYDASSQGYDCGSSGNWKEGSYTRVHRDQSIINAMRSWMGLNTLNENELYGKERAKLKFIKA